jgi:hypothetical protein
LCNRLRSIILSSFAIENGKKRCFGCKEIPPEAPSGPALKTGCAPLIQAHGLHRHSAIRRRCRSEYWNRRDRRRWEERRLGPCRLDSFEQLSYRRKVGVARTILRSHRTHVLVCTWISGGYLYQIAQVREEILRRVFDLALIGAKIPDPRWIQVPGRA